MKRLIYLFFCFILLQQVYAQHKIIKGDTLYWFYRENQMNKKLKLIDFDTLQSGFAFRFKNYGQVVEIWKTGHQLHGVLTNYIFRHLKRKTDTLYQKIPLDTAETRKTYALIQKSGILDLPPDSEIPQWKNPIVDGIVYIIEISEKNEYWFKTYVNPYAQDSIPESLVVMNFIDNISELLQLTKRYKTFQKKLPLSGCYNSGYDVSYCYVGNSYTVGYTGYTKLPLGFLLATTITHLGNKPTDLAIRTSYRFDTKSNYDFELNFYKGDLFLHHTENLSDFVSYRFRRLKTGFTGTNKVYQNQSLNYGINYYNISFFAGPEYAAGEKPMTGIDFGLSKSFERPYYTFSIYSSIFKSEINYGANIYRSFFYSTRVSIGIFFEKFKQYKDIGLELAFFW